jgi:hypothetical protein
MENHAMDSLIINDEKPAQNSVGAAVVLQQRQNLPSNDKKTPKTSSTNLQVSHLYSLMRNAQQYMKM